MSEEIKNKTGKRPRSLTSLTLGWLAEKVRKAEDIKEAIKSGQYKIDTKKVAASILNTDI
ncbi:MAG: flagellar biosynthesis anti-sigma factor FlgM [Candidatus Dadabacteria bacterium]|nr:MAG: flagellar biosynthesis anti-sigma factor FlgM [Candidatus Dadabacteria bacterium]